MCVGFFGVAEIQSSIVEALYVRCEQGLDSELRDCIEEFIEQAMNVEKGNRIFLCR